MNNKQRKRARKSKLMKRLIRGSLRRSSGTQNVTVNMKRKGSYMVCIYNGQTDGVLINDYEMSFTITELKVRKIL